jgi:hypothetical protein
VTFKAQEFDRLWLVWHFGIDSRERFRIVDKA